MMYVIYNNVYIFIGAKSILIASLYYNNIIITYIPTGLKN